MGYLCFAAVLCSIINAVFWSDLKAFPSYRVPCLYLRIIQTAILYLVLDKQALAIFLTLKFKHTTTFILLPWAELIINTRYPFQFP